MEDYWDVIKRRLRKFWRQGDRLVCIRVFESQDQTCKLCDKHPITKNHVIQNTRTRDSLIFGSHCIYNYKLAFKEMGYDVTIAYLPEFQDEAKHINFSEPGTVNYYRHENQAEDEYQESLSYEDYVSQGIKIDRSELETDGMGEFGDKLDWDESE
jgi:hypothetical protein